MREESAPSPVLPPAVVPEPPPRVAPRFEPPAAVQPAPEPGDWRAQWQRARRAFWEGRFDESVAAYRALIATDPQNWAAHGELGNVLYRQGEWDAAVDAFYDAALLLWQSGRTEDARHLARIIGNLQPGRDQGLTRIFSAGGHDVPQYPSHSRLVKPTESLMR
jgi:tetratricopeptide (TPR) repeat protein